MAVHVGACTAEGSTTENYSLSELLKAGDDDIRTLHAYWDVDIDSLTYDKSETDK